MLFRYAVISSFRSRISSPMRAVIIVSVSTMSSTFTRFSTRFSGGGNDRYRRREMHAFWRRDTTAQENERERTREDGCRHSQGDRISDQLCLVRETGSGRKQQASKTSPQNMLPLLPLSNKRYPVGSQGPDPQVETTLLLPSRLVLPLVGATARYYEGVYARRAHCVQATHPGTRCLQVR